MSKHKATSKRKYVKQHAIASRLQKMAGRADGGTLDLKFRETTCTDEDITSGGHLYVGDYVSLHAKDFEGDCILIDDRNGDVGLQLIGELRRISRIYDQLATGVQAGLFAKERRRRQRAIA